MKRETEKEDSVFQIQFYEAILKRKSDFIQVLIALGDLYTREGFYQKGLDIDKRLARLRPYNAVVLYNLACSYSLVGDTPNAFKSIQKAIECGYDDLAHLEQDADLDNLRKDLDFQQYFSEIKHKSLLEKKDGQ